MAGRYLLDTNAVISLLGGDLSTIRRLNDSDEIYLPSIALGELLYGARQSGRSTENLLRVREFAASIPILPVHESTAEMYGLIREGLKRRGKPIPENDIWISAIAMQHDLTVLTDDQHFAGVESLRVEFLSR